MENHVHEDCIMGDVCQKKKQCPMARVQEVLAGKRKILILWYLNYKILRFGELKRKLPDVTQKMLTQQLRALENDGLIIRNVYACVPPRVEYSLTDLGRAFIPLLTQMQELGKKLIINK